MAPQKFATFPELFQKATGEPDSFPYQNRFADADELYELIHVPTGAGKTATAVLGWLWRYFHPKKTTPRRLVYCLPMRVLVEQTYAAVEKWLGNLGLKEEVGVHVLMGGEDGGEWDLHPEKPAILIGTQDMLLSRALNRGYGMSRYRWPTHFGLLNNDALWVFDEIQLMGAGLATSTQLQAFRESFQTYGTTKTVWMSATLLHEWLASVDYEDRIPNLKSKTLALGPDDYKADGLRRRWAADKPLEAAEVSAEDTTAVAKFIARVHKEGSLTLVVVNAVDRSRELYDKVKTLYHPPKAKGRGKAGRAVEPDAEIDVKLINSRFRPRERAAWLTWLTQDEGAMRKEFPRGRIVIATQVVEAGVDLSARTLVTELAPWASLVQRFGRCNRRGEFEGPNPAQVYWVDVPEKKAAPYPPRELDTARDRIKTLADVGLKSLGAFFAGLSDSERSALLPFDPPHVVRRKDFVDLFDTTPDLAGNDVDVSRFIREGDDLDVQVFWREDAPDNAKRGSKTRRQEPSDSEKEVQPQTPQREELCPVSVARFRSDFLQKGKTAYRWDALDGQWLPVTNATADSVYPGQVFWVTADQGGYDKETGWDPTVKAVAPELFSPEPADESAPKGETATSQAEDGYDDDGDSRFQSGWQSIAEHTQEVVDEVAKVLGEGEGPDEKLPLTDEARAALAVAARWHDWGKAHESFQNKISDDPDAETQRPPEWAGRRDVAKASPQKIWGAAKRQLGDRLVPVRHFRHELASALGVLTLLNGNRAPADWVGLDPRLQNLALYLIAAHHGKVRLSIRSMPDERAPEAPDTLFARGVWAGDPLPEVELGGGVTAPEVKELDLTPMRLGRTNGCPSWAERMLGLRNHEEFGPLKLAYLEAVLRAADVRASRNAEGRARGGRS